jgi:hypothetical protein
MMTKKGKLKGDSQQERKNSNKSIATDAWSW